MGMRRVVVVDGWALDSAPGGISCAYGSPACTPGTRSRPARLASSASSASARRSTRTCQHQTRSGSATSAENCAIIPPSPSRPPTGATPLTDYAAFLESKAIRAPLRGVATMPTLAPHLFPFQRAAVEFGLRAGSWGLFYDTGLGKTAGELEWCRHAAEASNGRALILTPLAVARQIEAEGKRWGYPVRVIPSKRKPATGLTSATMTASRSSIPRPLAPWHSTSLDIEGVHGPHVPRAHRYLRCAPLADGRDSDPGAE